MSNPYRTGESLVPLTVEIETSDTFVEVSYYDRAGLFSKKTIEFVGHPTAYYCPNNLNKEVHSYSYIGYNDYDVWRTKIGSNQFVTFDDLLIPMHRVLDIVVETKKRIAVVDVEKRI